MVNLSAHLHVCTRFSRNGSAERELRLTDHVERWYEHNSVFRFGQTLVVDGVVRWDGYLNPDEIQAYMANPKNAGAFRPVDPVLET